VFFSLSATKLPHYMLPALTPLSCLLGKFWRDQFLGPPVSLNRSFLSAVCLSAVLTLAPAAIYFLRPQYASMRPALPFLILTLSLILASKLSRKNEWYKSFVAICLGCLVLFFSFSLTALPWIEKYRVMKPIGKAIRENAAPSSKVYGYFVSEPSLFFYGGRLFPSVEQGSVDDLLNSREPVLVVIKESRLQEMAPKIPYTVLERRRGFAENGGEMTLLLISNVAGVRDSGFGFRGKK
jgi:4-amino-4-deoxy-L-arabinose transferase-like glycosyltransferase